MKRHIIFIQFIIAVSVFILINPGCKKEEKNTPPVASFNITPGSGTLETIFSFDASGCKDEEDQSAVLQVRWDWESDGIFDTDFSTNKTLNHQFNHPGTYQITLEVKDSKDYGNSIKKSLVVEGIIPTVLTDSVININDNSATCGGNVISDNGMPVTARGICWDTDTDPTIADSHTSDSEGTGKFVSYLTGLTKNTTYYVRAYATNETGTAYGNEVHFTTPDLWLCGDPVAINHIAGSVAPVDKTVTYQTVSNIPGEPALCWITSNLGADHQAAAVDDATEASAGWYWQFNRIQGYKHDGVNRIPVDGWLTSIDENADWYPSNDPCASELGTGWRIPTQSEWNNVKQWTEWNGAWNSPLKLHAAGFIYYDDVFHDRGVQGVYWSTLQGGNQTGWYMRFTSSLSVLAGNEKEMANTLRCVKE